MVRTGAGRLYGWRTALYGTLLPSPMIALSFPNLVKDILSDGHDAEFHAWDHRRWQDELPARPYGWIENWFERGVEAYRGMAGREPSSFGAPAWLIRREGARDCREIFLSLPELYAGPRALYP